MIADIGIFSEECEKWGQVSVAKNVGANKVLASTSGQGLIAINDSLLKQGGASSECLDANADKPFSVGNDDIELTLFHEMVHVIEQSLKGSGQQLPSEQFGWTVPRLSNGQIDFTKPTTFGYLQFRGYIPEFIAVNMALSLLSVPK